MPGGFGTMDELFEAITLIQTKKITKRPVVLVGTEYWSGLVEWVKKIMLEKENNISADDLRFLTIVDTADEAVKYVEDFYKTHDLSPNF
ncbi:putative lysine decarboxylase [compost metagenome]